MPFTVKKLHAVDALVLYFYLRALPEILREHADPCILPYLQHYLLLTLPITFNKAVKLRNYTKMNLITIFASRVLYYHTSDGPAVYSLSLLNQSKSTQQTRTHTPLTFFSFF
jgi:hypothetical protein